jgi:cold shock CspA family protein
MPSGTVLNYHADKGFGFIRPDVKGRPRAVSVLIVEEA